MRKLTPNPSVVNATPHQEKLPSLRPQGAELVDNRQQHHEQLAVAGAIENSPRMKQDYAVQLMADHYVANAKSSGEIIQRNRFDSAPDFIGWIEMQGAYTENCIASAGACAPAAQAIIELLGIEEYDFTVLGIKLYPELAAGERASSMNHYAVCVNVGGQQIVVDPTIGQFGADGPVIAARDTWESTLAGLQVTVAILSGGREGQAVAVPLNTEIQDFADFASANEFARKQVMVRGPNAQPCTIL